MNYSVLILLFLVIFLICQRRKRIAIIKSVIDRRKRKREKGKMEESAKKYIGKDCLIYTALGSDGTVKGVIKEVTDGAITVDSDGNFETVNLDFVVRIREWPKNKKGKKKTIFA